MEDLEAYDEKRLIDFINTSIHPSSTIGKSAAELNDTMNAEDRALDTLRQSLVEFYTNRNDTAVQRDYRFFLEQYTVVSRMGCLNLHLLCDVFASKVPHIAYLKWAEMIQNYFPCKL